MSFELQTLFAFFSIYTAALLVYLYMSLSPSQHSLNKCAVPEQRAIIQKANNNLQAYCDPKKH